MVYPHPSPHPDDVEYSMLGSIMKHQDTHFDILCMTKGGAKGFDKTFAQMSKQEKGTISHRGIATSKLVEFLQRV